MKILPGTTSLFHNSLLREELTTVVLGGIRRGRTAGFWALVVAVCAVIAGALWYIIWQGGGSLPVIAQAADFTATNVDGRAVTLSQLNGKVRLMTWFYTHCPDECPLTAYQMEQVQNQLIQSGSFGKQVAFISMTFDPNRDTLPVIKQWASHYHPDFAGWYFLRADEPQTQTILKKWGVQTRFGDTEYIEHIVKTVLIDNNGNVRKTYNTANLNVTEVVNDINGLIQRSRWNLQQ